MLLSTRIIICRAQPVAVLCTRQTFLSRGIRIKSSSGEQRSGPSEEHTVEKKRHPSSNDTQAQQAQGTMQTPESERPVYVDGRLYKGDSTGMGGASQGSKEEAAPPSWWASMKKKMGIDTSEREAKHGSQSGNLGP